MSGIIITVYYGRVYRTVRKVQRTKFTTNTSRSILLSNKKYYYLSNTIHTFFD